MDREKETQGSEPDTQEACDRAQVAAKAPHSTTGICKDSQELDPGPMDSDSVLRRVQNVFEWLRPKRKSLQPEERYAQCCISERVAYGGGSVMFWGGISYDARTELVFVPGGGRGGGLNAARYITEILEDHVVPYAGIFDEGFMLMQDNTPCHTARVTAAYLREVGIDTMVWPAMSPDLHPIEHMWDRLKRNVRARNPAPATVDELKIALTEEWEALPQNYIRKLIKSMKNRLLCVIRARGGNTRY